MKIESAVRGPGRELFKIIVNDAVRRNNRHFPAELRAAPRPIKVAVRKWKIFLVKAAALLPRLASNQKRAGKNNVAGPPTNSVARLPGRIVRRVQIQSGREVLSDSE